MKKKIIALLVILAIMAAIPPISNINSLDLRLKNKKNELITAATAYHFRKHYNDKTIKAIVIILNSNYKANKLNKKEIIDKKKFIKKFKKGSDYYSKIENTVAKYEDFYITYKGKPAYIPCFKLSKGFTEKDKKLPYLKASACPWDVFKKDFKNSANTVGISINSLDKLISKGAGINYALRHFLNSKCKILP